MKKFIGSGVTEYNDGVYQTTINIPHTDYDRINPICLMLSDCDLAIIEKHKTDGQDVRDFLQRLISENLRVLRDRTPGKEPTR